MDKTIQVEAKDRETLELPFMEPSVGGNLKKAMSTAGATSNDLWRLDPFSITVVDSYNVREKDEQYEKKVCALFESMMDPEVGFRVDDPVTVIVVKKDGENVIQLKQGHRRLEAAKRAIKAGAKFTQIYAIATQHSMSEEELLADLHVSNSSDPLQPYELAKLIKMMTVYSELPRIAQKLSLDVSWVQDLLLLINGPFVIREYVRKRTIAATFAIDTMKAHGNKAVALIESAVQRAKAGGKSTASAQHLPGAKLKKAVARAAPQMRTVIADVKEDPAYAQLSQETRTRIEAIYETLKAAEDEEQKLAEQVAAESDKQSGQTAIAA